MKQLSLIPPPPKEHGGQLLHKKRKTRRPLSTKKLLHLVLKCKKKISLRKNKDFIEQTIYRQAQLAKVTIYSMSVQRDHIHHSIKFREQSNYNRFVRSVTSLLARRFGHGLWEYRPYTRIVEWGRDQQNLLNYIHQNELEAIGIIPYRPRKK